MLGIYDKCNVWKRWVQVYHSGKRIENYFHKYNIKTIAIYGMSDVGDFLYGELINTDIMVRYGIDINRDYCSYNLPIKRPEEVEDDVDAIIVTPVSAFSEIFDYLSKYVPDCNKIIGIDEVFADLLTEDYIEVDKENS